MSKRTSLPLLGFVELGLRGPCFLLPIFGSKSSPRIQQGDANDRVVGFSPCSLAPGRRLIRLGVPKTSQKVGDHKLYAFQFSGGSVATGNKHDIRQILNKRLRSFRKYPYLKLEIRAFVEAADKQRPRPPVKLAGELSAKDEIVRQLAEKCRTEKELVASMLKELRNLTVQQCTTAGEFRIPNIAHITKEHRVAYIRHNPRTGEPIRVKAKAVLALRPAKRFEEAVLAGVRR